MDNIRYEFLPVEKSGKVMLPYEIKAVIQATAKKHQSEGAVWMRVTQVDRNHRPNSDGVIGFWFESMTSKPSEEPEFDPPLTVGVN